MEIWDILKVVYTVSLVVTFAAMVIDFIDEGVWKSNKDEAIMLSLIFGFSVVPLLNTYIAFVWFYKILTNNGVYKKPTKKKKNRRFK